MASPTTINDLELVCVLQVFSHLDGRQVALLALVQRQWRDLLADSDHLWRGPLEEDYGGEEASDSAGALLPSYRCDRGSTCTSLAQVLHKPSTSLL